MKNLSSSLIFHILFGISFLRINILATPSINKLAGKIMSTVIRYKGQKVYYALSNEMASDIRYLYRHSPTEFLEMVNSFNDIVANELIFSSLADDYGLFSFDFSGEDNNLFSSYLENVNRVVCKLLFSPFDSVEGMKRNFNSIEMMIRITRKNISKAKRQIAINLKLAKGLAKMEKTIKNWEHVIRNFSFDPIKKTIDFAAFSNLFDQIIGFSLLPEYNADNEKYYILFRVYLTLLWNRHLKGLFEAHMKNLETFIFYLYDCWEISFFDYENTFLCIRNFQKDRKKRIGMLCERMKYDISAILRYYKSGLKLEIPSYPLSLTIEIVESLEEKTKPFGSRFGAKLKAFAYLKDLMKDHPPNKQF
jgi:hypothetical protein